MTSDIYINCCRKNENFKLNMPETIANVFLAMFDDESWTWRGLAELAKERYSIADREELIDALRASLG